MCVCVVLTLVTYNKHVYILYTKELPYHLNNMLSVNCRFSMKRVLNLQMYIATVKDTHHTSCKGNSVLVWRAHLSNYRVVGQQE